MYFVVWLSLPLVVWGVTNTPFPLTLDRNCSGSYIKFCSEFLTKNKLFWNLKGHLFFSGANREGISGCVISLDRMQGTALGKAMEKEISAITEQKLCQDLPSCHICLLMYHIMQHPLLMMHF